MKEKIELFKYLMMFLVLLQIKQGHSKKLNYLQVR